MEEAVEQLVAQLKQKFIRPEAAVSSSFTEDVVRFYHAVSWSEEGWLWTLFALHGLLLAAVILSQHSLTVQFVLFVLILVLGSLAERLNTWAADNWGAFATQNYFDSNGLFLAVVYALPLIVIGFVQVVSELGLETKTLSRDRSPGSGHRHRLCVHLYIWIEKSSFA